VTNNQNQTFIHVLLINEHYEFVQELLTEHMGTYHFDCDLLDKDGRSIKVC